MAWTGHGKNFFNPVKTGCVHLITGGVVDRFHSRTRSVVRPALVTALAPGCIADGDDAGEMRARAQRTIAHEPERLQSA